MREQTQFTVSTVTGGTYDILYVLDLPNLRARRVLDYDGWVKLAGADPEAILHGVTENERQITRRAWPLQPQYHADTAQWVLK